MWIKRTGPELVEAKQRATRRQQRNAVLLGLLITVVVFIPGGKGASPGNQRSLIFPDDLINRVPFAVALGIVAAWLTYRRPLWRPAVTVVCDKCAHIKREDATFLCGCGGHYHNIEEMKWVD